MKKKQTPLRFDFALRTESMSGRSLFKPDIPALRFPDSCAISSTTSPSSAMHRNLFRSGDVDTTGSTDELLDVTVDGCMIVLDC